MVPICTLNPGHPNSSRKLALPPNDGRGGGPTQAKNKQEEAGGRVPLLGPNGEHSVQSEQEQNARCTWTEACFLPLALSKVESPGRGLREQPAWPGQGTWGESCLKEPARCHLRGGRYRGGECLDSAFFRKRERKKKTKARGGPSLGRGWHARERPSQSSSLKQHSSSPQHLPATRLPRATWYQLQSYRNSEFK